LDGACLDLKSEALEELLEVDIEDWLNETELIQEQFDQFGGGLPEALNKKLASTRQRLRRAEAYDAAWRRIIVDSPTPLRLPESSDRLNLD
jgi:hypothetical protein